MALQARFGGDDGEITLKVDRYERALDEPGSHDANWLTGSVELDLRGEDRFRATCPIAWTTSELGLFCQQLRRLLLEEPLTGTARLKTLEEQVSLKIDLIAGQGSISGFVQEHARACLEFESLQTDQSHLRDALGGLERITSEFPPR